jgi:hypothetical protein
MIWELVTKSTLERTEKGDVIRVSVYRVPDSDLELLSSRVFDPATGKEVADDSVPTA